MVGRCTGLTFDRGSAGLAPMQHRGLAAGYSTSGVYTISLTQCPSGRDRGCGHRVGGAGRETHWGFLRREEWDGGCEQLHACIARILLEGLNPEDKQLDSKLFHPESILGVEQLANNCT